MKEPKDMQAMLESIENKLNTIMEHLGCPGKDYDKMSSEEKDKTDEEDVMGKEDED